MTKQKEQSAFRDFVDLLDRICGEMGKNRELADRDSFDAFGEKVRSISAHIDGIMTEGRKLRIGIVGNVKAGKSSFLNALIFSGRDILPKAVTPMTAALTKIGYSEFPSAKVFFYEVGDWERIKRQYETYKEETDIEYSSLLKAWDEKASDPNVPIPPRPDRKQAEATVLYRKSVSAKASIGLATEVYENGLDPDAYLGKVHTISAVPSDSPEQYMERLQNYVGANGKFTPLVKYTEMRLKHPALMDIEIIDTPGLGDPVISRSYETKRSLSECDFVFVLTPSTQFLDAGIMDLIKVKLRENSIKRMCVVGTKLDMALQSQRTRGKKPYQAVYQDVINILTQRYQRELLEKNDPEMDIKPEHAPFFVSSLFYGIAQKRENQELLSDAEENTVDKMHKRFADFSEKDCYQLGGFTEIPTFLEKIRNEKNGIIQERVASYKKEQAAELVKVLDQLITAAQIDCNHLRSGDAEKLSQREAFLISNLSRVQNDITGIFGQYRNRMNRAFQESKIELSREIGNHEGLNIEKRNTEASHAEHYGLFGMMQRTHYYLKESYLSDVSDVVAAIREYGTESQSIISQSLQKPIDYQKMRTDITNCVAKVFEPNFDLSEITMSIDAIFTNLLMPPVEFDFVEDAEKAVYSQFPEGMVEGDEIHKLNECKTKELHNVFRKQVAKLDESNADYTKIMETLEVGFVDTIKKKIHANIERTQSLLHDRQNNIARYERFIQDLEDAKMQLNILRGL